MPCPQRRNRRSPPRHFARFHPYMMIGQHPHHHPAAALLFDQATEEMMPSFLQGKAQISDGLSVSSSGDKKDLCYVIEMAVPGVQSSNITIEEKKGELEVTAIRLGPNKEVIKTYQEVLFLHPSKADFANLDATTKHGILTIRIPKKFQEQVLKIETESAQPPPPRATAPTHEPGSDDTAMGQEDGEEKPKEKEDLYVSWDLPGYSANELTVEFHNERDENQLLVVAQKNGNPMRLRRLMTVPSFIDMTQAAAYLQHGVFTLVAPCRHQEESVATSQEDPQNLVRTFYVTPEDDVMLSQLSDLASFQINEKKEKESSPSDHTNDVASSPNTQEWETVDGADLSDTKKDSDNK